MANAPRRAQDLDASASQARTVRAPVPAPSDDEVARAILALCAARGPDKSICPSEAARRIAGPDGDWRRLMPEVRAVAIALADQGTIVVLQRRARIDPRTARGAIRLAIVAGGGTLKGAQG